MSLRVSVRAARSGIARAGLVAMFACSAPGGAGVALPPGARPTRPAIGLAATSISERPGLAYDVWIGPDRLVTVELEVEFVLAVRELDADGRVTRRRHIRLGPPDWDVSALAVSPDGRAAFVAVTDGTIREIELDGPRERRRFNLGAPATAVAVASGGRLLLTGTATGVVCLRRLADAALLQCVVAHRGPVSAVDAHADLAASASWDGEVVAWRLPSLAPIRRFAGRGAANAVALSPDGRSLAVARSGDPPRRSVEVARRERELGVADDPAAVVELVSLMDARPRELRGHRAPVTSVAWTPDGRQLISGSWDRTVRLWDIPSGREVARREGFPHLVRAVAIASDGRWAAAAAWAPHGGGPTVALFALLYPEPR